MLRMSFATGALLCSLCNSAVCPQGFGAPPQDTLGKKSSRSIDPCSPLPDWLVYPGEEWETATAQEAGLDPASFNSWVASKKYTVFGYGDEAPGDYGAVLSRGGKIVASWGNPDHRWQTASVGKLFTKLVVQLTEDYGKINSTHDLIKDYWVGDGRGDQGKLNHPDKYMTSGHHNSLRFSHLVGLSYPKGMVVEGTDQLGGFPVTNGSMWKKKTRVPPWANWHEGNPDRANYAQIKPGTTTYYASGGLWRVSQALTYIWDKDVKDVLDEMIMSKIGIPADRWDWLSGHHVRFNKLYRNYPDYGEFCDEPHKIKGHWVRGGGGWVVMSPKDLARVSLLLACGGWWKGERLVNLETYNEAGHSGGGGSYCQAYRSWDDLDLYFSYGQVTMKKVGGGRDEPAADQLAKFVTKAPKWSGPGFAGGSRWTPYAERGETTFRAYNDLAWTDGQINKNITTLTAGQSGALVDFSSGESACAIRLSVSDTAKMNASRGEDAPRRTDSYQAFGGKVDCRGALTASGPGAHVRLTFSGLNPQKRYDCILFANRGGTRYANWKEDAFIEIEGAESFRNESSLGTGYETPSDPRSVIINGYNTLKGNIARFTNIQPGADGEFSIRQIESNADRKVIYANAVMLREYCSDRERLVEWKRSSNKPVLGTGPTGAWDEHIRERMWVIHEDGMYHAWYCGWRGVYAKSRPNLLHLGYATSADGIRWTKHPNNPVFDKRWTEDICVVKDDNTYYMYAEDESDGKTCVHLLTSRNKVNWTPRGQVLEAVPGSSWEDDWVGTPVVFKVGRKWHMLYEGGAPGYVGLAHSADGIHWVRDEHNPVFTTAGSKHWERDKVVPQSIVRVGERWHLFYHATGDAWQTGVASSRDLIRWKRYRGNPIVKDKSAVIVESGRSYLLYTQKGPDGEAIILHTLSKDAK